MTCVPANRSPMSLVIFSRFRLTSARLSGLTSTSSTSVSFCDGARIKSTRMQKRRNPINGISPKQNMGNVTVILHYAWLVHTCSLTIASSITFALLTSACLPMTRTESLAASPLIGNTTRHFVSAAEPLIVISRVSDGRGRERGEKANRERSARLVGDRTVTTWFTADQEDTELG